MGKYIEETGYEMEKRQAAIKYARESLRDSLEYLNIDLTTDQVIGLFEAWDEYTRAINEA